jgi:hypothetical protein
MDASPTPGLEDKLQQLMGMGFKRDMCEKALVNSKNRFNTAVDWLIAEGALLLNRLISTMYSILGENAIDFGLEQNNSNDSTSAKVSEIEVDPDKVAQLMNMGFTRQQCRSALKKGKCNLEDALSLLLDGADLPEEKVCCLVVFVIIIAVTVVVVVVLAVVAVVVFVFCCRRFCCFDETDYAMLIL